MILTALLFNLSIRLPKFCIDRSFKSPHAIVTWDKKCYHLLINVRYDYRFSLLFSYYKQQNNVFRNANNISLLPSDNTIIFIYLWTLFYLVAFCPSFIVSFVILFWPPFLKLFLYLHWVIDQHYSCRVWIIVFVDVYWLGNLFLLILYSVTFYVVI